MIWELETFQKQHDKRMEKYIWYDYMIKNCSGFFCKKNCRQFWELGILCTKWLKGIDSVILALIYDSVKKTCPKSV